MGDKFAGVPTFTQHTTVTERAAAAAEFVRDYDWTIPMHLDTLENDVVTQLGRWLGIVTAAAKDEKLREGAVPGRDSLGKRQLQRKAS